MLKTKLPGRVVKLADLTYIGLEEAQEATKEKPEAATRYLKLALELADKNLLSDEDKNDFYSLLNRIAESPNKSLVSILRQGKRGRSSLSRKTIKERKNLAVWIYAFNQLDKNKYHLHPDSDCPGAIEAALKKFRICYPDSHLPSVEMAVKAWEAHKGHAKERHNMYAKEGVKFSPI